MLSTSKLLAYRVYRTPGCPSIRVDVQVKPQRDPLVVSAASADRGSSGASFGLLNSLLWTWTHGSTLTTQSAKQKWLQGVSADRLSRLLLASSVLPAVLLSLQPLSSLQQCPSGTGLPWQGPLRDMFSFTVLLGVFIGSEPAAAVASAVSAAGAALILVIQAEHLPLHAAIAAVLLATAVGFTLLAAARPSQAMVTGRTQHQQFSLLQMVPSIARLMSWGPAPSSQPAGTSSSTAVVGPDDVIKDHSSRAQGDLQSRQQEQDPSALLQRVQQLLGVLGGGLLLQFVVSTAIAQLQHSAPAAWLLPVGVGAAAVVAAGRWIHSSAPESSQLQELRADWPAWSATLLLILHPLHQLVDMALNPAAVVPETSASQLLLLVLANGLMVPRAVLTRQIMWFTGTCSGTLLAAGQLLVLGLHSLCVGLHLPMLALAGGVDSQALSLPVGMLPQAQLGSKVGSSFVNGVPGVTVVALMVWLWLSVAVLQHGWRYIQANKPATQ